MSSIAHAAHTRTARTTDVWITPKWLIDWLGSFDLDPCANDPMPWPTAARWFTEKHNGLSLPWGNEFVWCNPPYGPKATVWLERMALHNNGIALVFARTETRMFFRHVWPSASALLFLRGRITFCRRDGESSKVGHNSGGPSVLIAYGEKAADRLHAVSDLGAFVALKGAT